MSKNVVYLLITKEKDMITKYAPIDNSQLDIRFDDRQNQHIRLKSCSDHLIKVQRYALTSLNELTQAIERLRDMDRRLSEGLLPRCSKYVLASFALVTLATATALLSYSIFRNDNITLGEKIFLGFLFYFLAGCLVWVCKKYLQDRELDKYNLEFNRARKIGDPLQIFMFAASYCDNGKIPERIALFKVFENPLMLKLVSRLCIEKLQERWESIEIEEIVSGENIHLRNRTLSLMLTPTVERMQAIFQELSNSKIPDVIIDIIFGYLPHGEESDL